MDKLREQIIQFADKMFKQLGIRNVSIDQVCTELRISKKTFYFHFAQKEDLVEAIIDYDRQVKFEKFEKNMRNKNAIDGLIFIIKEVKKNQDCSPPLLWHDLQKYYPKLYENYNSRKIESIRLGFEHNLKQGIAEGYYRENLDIELISWFHAIQMKNTFEEMNQMNKKYNNKRIMDFFIDLMIHLIANEKGLNYMKENNMV